MDINEHPKAVDTINKILENKGIAEIKVERNDVLVVVEVGRTVKYTEKENG